MLHLIPHTLPRLSLMLPALGADHASIARALAVSERTVYRWAADDLAPRAAALALFWVTPWGWSQVISEAGQRIQTAEALAQARAEDCRMLAARIARLERLGDFGSINAPLYRVG